MRPSLLAALAILPLGFALALPAAAGDTSGQETACLPGLRAYTQDGGSITLVWPPVANATAYQVVVKPAGGDFTPLTPQATAGSESYLYTPPVPAESYEFALVAILPGTHPLPYCHTTVARVPFFPAWTATVLGLVVGLGGVSLLLRRP